MPKSLFCDRVQLTLSSGNGGNGAVSFRREKYVPKGGPDGGDGGKGGDVVFVAKKNLATFTHLHGKRKFQAQHGSNGRKSRSAGKNADNLIIPVPQGTLIKSILPTQERTLFDLKTTDNPLNFLKGGDGGRGNYHFRTSTQQAPRICEKGRKGTSIEIVLEVRIIADVGLAGAPNAGKSSLLKAITNANPKIGPFPFTTLAPNLGAYSLQDASQLIIADIPGLIEDAHKGKGLGTQFLKHLSRAAFLLFLIDVTEKNPYITFEKIQKEMILYQPSFLNYAFAIAISKLDLIPHPLRETTKQKIKNMFPQKLQKKLLFLGNFTSPNYLEQIGISELTALLKAVAKRKKNNL